MRRGSPFLVSLSVVVYFLEHTHTHNKKRCTRTEARLLCSIGITSTSRPFGMVECIEQKRVHVSIINQKKKMIIVRLVIQSDNHNRRFYTFLLSYVYLSLPDSQNANIGIVNVYACVCGPLCSFSS